MGYDTDKIDEMVLALLWLTETGDGRTWKGHDWDAMDRLHAKGYISDPRSKAKSGCSPKRVRSGPRNYSNATSRGSVAFAVSEAVPEVNLSIAPRHAHRDHRTPALLFEKRIERLQQPPLPLRSHHL